MARDKIKLEIKWKPEEHQPREIICPLCQWPASVMPWEKVDDPFICGWCLDRGRHAPGVRMPGRNDEIWFTRWGQKYRSAIAAWYALERELMIIRHQRRTGKQGEHPRWLAMTPEQRREWKQKPAPLRAYMP